MFSRDGLVCGPSDLLTKVPVHTLPGSPHCSLLAMFIYYIKGGSISMGRNIYISLPHIQPNTLWRIVSTCPFPILIYHQRKLYKYTIMTLKLLRNIALALYIYIEKIFQTIDGFGKSEWAVSLLALTSIDRLSPLAPLPLDRLSPQQPRNVFFSLVVFNTIRFYPRYKGCPTQKGHSVPPRRDMKLI